MSGGGASADEQLAAQLVVEGLLLPDTARAVLAKVKELAERGRPLSTAEICVRKGWIGEAELALLQGRLPVDFLPGLRLGEAIARGGMARVFRATDISGHRGEAVAVKILTPKAVREERTRAEFRFECDLACKLRDPHLTAGRRAFEHEGLVGLVMELVEGPSLAEHLAEKGRLEQIRALQVVLAVARALRALGEAGIVHRDVKPANVLLGAGDTVKLADLGLAVRVGEGAGETTAGTAAYVSPEQARAREGLDARSDFYSLGVVLFEAIVGELPFQGETNEETMAQRLQDELRSPKLKGAAVSPRVFYVVKKLTSLDPSLRPPDAAALITELEGILEELKAAEPRAKRSAPIVKRRGIRRR